jgi:hypothetical protein
VKVIRGLQQSNALYGMMSFACEKAGFFVSDTSVNIVQPATDRKADVCKTKKCECPWKIKVLLLFHDYRVPGNDHLFKKGAYVLTYPTEGDDTQNGHNHELGKATITRNHADVDMTYTTDDIAKLWVEADELFSKNVSQGSAFDILVKNPAYAGYLQDNGIYNAQKLNSKVRHLSGSNTARDRDETNFINYFFEKKAANEDFYFEYRKDACTGDLDAAIWGGADMRHAAELYGGELVVFDLTHLTNWMNLFLGVFVVEDCYGETTIIALCFVKRQDVSSLKWCFTQFIQLNHNVKPKIMMTDGCVVLAKAILAIFEHWTRHLLCIWHILAKNIKSHLRKYMDEADAQIIVSKMWKFVKREDTLSTEEDLQEEFQEICNTVNFYSDSRSKQKAVKSQCDHDCLGPATCPQH